MEEKKYKLKKIVDELREKSGRHTELISLYIPQGFNLNEISNLISQEISLTQNVKSKTVRKNVISALTKIQQYLKHYRQTPPNGLVIFCGNVSEKEGETDIKIWALEPPEPIKMKLYWCDQKFELGPLEEMMKEKDVYGLITLDKSDATLGILRGKKINIIKRLHSIVPGKTRAGGQSSARFQRVRAGLLNDFLKEIGENFKKVFSEEDIKGIIVGGPGPIKEKFVNENYIPENLKKKIIGIKDIGYSDEYGLEELLNRSQDLLKEAEVAKEKELCEKFFDELKRDTGKATYGLEDVKKAIEMGAVETVLISEGLEIEEVEYECSCGYREKKFVKTNEKENQKCPKCGDTMKIIGEADIVDVLEDMAKETGAKIEIISRDTSEGERLYLMGGIGAILRFPIE
ncbi:MAG: peptide chain release factor aRF-1 [Candidatus Aenigmarchaeota archaeon]|nr:peptide chain release factor aRF-1 [Candidatus Aenigmarchaeota archaeon]